MYKQEDSLGRELLAEETLQSILTFGSYKNFPSSSEKTAAGIRITCLREGNTGPVINHCSSPG